MPIDETMESKMQRRHGDYEKLKPPSFLLYFFLTVIVMSSVVWGAIQYWEYTEERKIRNIFKQGDTELYFEQFNKNAINWQEAGSYSVQKLIEDSNDEILCHAIPYLPDNAIYINETIFNQFEPPMNKAMNCYLRHPLFKKFQIKFSGFSDEFYNLEDVHFNKIIQLLEIGFDITESINRYDADAELDVIQIPVEQYLHFYSCVRSSRWETCKKEIRYKYEYLPIPGNVLLSDVLERVKSEHVKSNFGRANVATSTLSRIKSFRPLNRAILLNKTNYINLFISYGAKLKDDTPNAIRLITKLSSDKAKRALILSSLDVGNIKKGIVKGNNRIVKNQSYQTVRAEFESDIDMIKFISQYGSLDLLRWSLKHIKVNDNVMIHALLSAYASVFIDKFEWFISSYDYSKTLMTPIEFSDLRGIKENVLSVVFSPRKSKEPEKKRPILELISLNAHGFGFYFKSLIVDSHMQGWQHYHHLVLSSDVDSIEAYFNKHPELLEGITKTGATPFHLAIRYGRLDIAEKLLKMGGDIDREDNKRLTALAYASGEGNYQAVKFLIDNAASLVTTGREDCSIPLTLVKNKLIKIGDKLANILGIYARKGHSVNGFHVPNLMKTEQLLTEVSKDAELDVCRASISKLNL